MRYGTVYVPLIQLRNDLEVHKVVTKSQFRVGSPLSCGLDHGVCRFVKRKCFKANVIHIGAMFNELSLQTLLFMPMQQVLVPQSFHLIIYQPYVCYSHSPQHIASYNSSPITSGLPNKQSWSIPPTATSPASKQPIPKP